MPATAMSGSNNSRWWLTPQRLRAHATILALCLWGLYLWNMAPPGLHDRSGNLKGTDFLHFYTLGSLALEHRSVDLYDIDVQAALAARRVPEAAGIRYLPLYPPQVSLFLATLARLSYSNALIAWLTINTAIYALCVYGLWRACPNLQKDGWTVFLLAAAFPPFFHLIAWGQTSGFALACFALAFLALRSDKKFLAGIALGCLIFKPQLGLAAAIIFLSIGAWKIIAGAIVSASVQLLAGGLYYGMEPLREWTHTLLRVRELLPLLEPKPYQTHSLRTFWNMLIPWPEFSFALYVLSACILLALTIGLWSRKSQAPLALRYSSLLLVTILAAPHLTVYDLVILLPAFFLLADWIVDQPRTVWIRRFAGLLYLTYLAPLLGPLDQWTHVQISGVVMAAAIFMIWQFSKKELRVGGTGEAKAVLSAK